LGKFWQLCGVFWQSVDSIQQVGVLVTLVTGHFKNNDSEFSERLRGAEVAVYVNVCRFEILNCY